MPRPTYCTPVDVLRRFDPQEGQNALDTNEYIGSGHDEEQVLARIEGVEAKFERDARPFRPVRAGAGNKIYKSAKGRGFPIKIYLDHRDILPIDSAQGDVVERRTGRDSWDDITNEEGDSWVADYRKGTLTVFAVPGRGHLPVLRNFRERYLRISYRHGGPGGGQRKGGQTTLAQTLPSGAATGVSVDDAGRLPVGGGTMLIGGVEYVRVTGVDTAAGTIDIDARGLRGTTDKERADDSVIHYCPMDVREAIASKAAKEAVLYDDWVDQLVNTGSGAPQPNAKLEEWQSEYDDTVSNYSDNWGYR